jgi:hypothetical protein
MTDRMYRGLLGAAILIALYFELSWLMFVLIGLLFAEGVTNQRVPKLFNMLRHFLVKDDMEYANDGQVTNPKFNVDSERVWRLTVGLFLLVSFSYIEALWWFPWFMGFAIFGAGLSGVCPVLFAIRRTGFR